MPTCWCALSSSGRHAAGRGEVDMAYPWAREAGSVSAMLTHGQAAGLRARPPGHPTLLRGPQTHTTSSYARKALSGNLRLCERAMRQQRGQEPAAAAPKLAAVALRMGSAAEMRLWGAGMRFASHDSWRVTQIE